MHAQCNTMNTMAIWGYIYKITNLEEGKSYIGSTEGKLSKRWNAHRCVPVIKMKHLKDKMHTLQYDILEYGFFDDRKALHNREDIYMDKFDTVFNGYNTTYNERKRTPEFCQNIRDKTLNKPKRRN